MYINFIICLQVVSSALIFIVKYLAVLYLLFFLGKKVFVGYSSFVIPLSLLIASWISSFFQLASRKSSIPIGYRGFFAWSCVYSLFSSSSLIYSELDLPNWPSIRFLHLLSVTGYFFILNIVIVLTRCFNTTIGLDGYSCSYIEIIRMFKARYYSYITIWYWMRKMLSLFITIGILVLVDRHFLSFLII